MNHYAKFVHENYDAVRKYPVHERFKELAKMWRESKKPKSKKSTPKETTK